MMSWLTRVLNASVLMMFVFDHQEEKNKRPGDSFNLGEFFALTMMMHFSVHDAVAGGR